MRFRQPIAVIIAIACLAARPSPSVSAVSRASLPRTARPIGDGRYAVPLFAPKPAWYTSKLHRRVLSAAARGEGVPFPEHVRKQHPMSSLLFRGIRPGSWMISPARCTMNWVFGDVKAALRRLRAARRGPRWRRSRYRTRVYIGTAGHCTKAGDRVVIAAVPGVLLHIGWTVKSVDRDLGNDFAFVEIRPEMLAYVSPSMAHLGGPTTIKPPALRDAIVHTGHGVGIGTGGTPRTGVVMYSEGPRGNTFGWSGAAIFGDSGSPVRHAGGAAAGNLTHLIIHQGYLPAFFGGTTIQRILRRSPAPLATTSLIPQPL